MILTGFTIENFKAISAPVKVDFRPITLLFGPNSGGKSTIIQALHYAREIFERGNADPGRTLAGGTSIDLGGFKNIVNDNDLKKTIRFRFDLNPKEFDINKYLKEHYFNLDYYTDTDFWLYPVTDLIKKVWVEISIKWSFILDKPIINSYEVGYNQDVLARITGSDNSSQIILAILNIDHPIFDTDFRDINEERKEIFSWWRRSISIIKDEKISENQINFVLSGQDSVLPTIGKLIKLDDQNFSEGSIEEDGINLLEDKEEFNVQLSTLIGGSRDMIKQALKKMLYLGPLREIPCRNYEPPISIDESRWATGIAAYDILFQSSKKFIEKINKWLSHSNRLNSGYKLEVKHYKEIDVNSHLMQLLSQEHGPDEENKIKCLLDETSIKTRVFLRDKIRGIEVQPQDVGVGISQVLPVVVGALHLEKGIMIIEQPELHIHPAFQVALGDLFISQINEKKAMFLIETHSEHLMLRFLRRIRETNDCELPHGISEFRPEHLAVYYVENDKSGVSLTPIGVDKGGDFIDRWPNGFFSERIEELY